MSDPIHPRSLRKTMDGWVHLAGKLHSDYQASSGNGLDGRRAMAAGVTHSQLLAV